MKPLNKRTLVKVEKRVNDKVKVGGREFDLDPIFREYWNTVQMAEVCACDRDDIKPGDIVYVHHFVNAPEQKLPIKGTMSFLEHNQIYAKREDGKVKPLTTFVLVEPVTYGQAGVVTNRGGLLLSTHSEHDHVEKIGIARHLSQQAMDEGLKEGDLILFNKNCEYEILIEDKIMYRMEIRDVITPLDSFEDLQI